jgi:hypothetical protein
MPQAPTIPATSITSGTGINYTGGCACGAVRYRLETSPLFVNCCHCTACQTETGSAFVINALIEADRVTTTKGTPASVLTPSESGKGQQIWRCPDCHVALWSNYGGARDVIRFVRVGTLDNPAAVPPDVHIFTRSRLPWVILPPDKPAVPEYFDIGQLWPAESLERRKAAYARAAQT